MSVTCALLLPSPADAHARIFHRLHRYVIHSSKEGGKVLNQLIDTLLKPIEDVPRYICVLQHLCWLCEQVSESEIVCPIVEYATQLIPQLQQMWKSIQALREAHLADCDDSDSDVELRNNFGNGAPKIKASSTSGASSELAKHHLHANEPARKQHSSSLNFRSVMRAIELKIANDRGNPELRQSSDISSNVAAPATRTPTGNHSSHSFSPSLQSEFDSEAPQFELHEMHSAASSPSVAADDGDSDAEVSSRVQDDSVAFDIGWLPCNSVFRWKDYWTSSTGRTVRLQVIQAHDLSKQHGHLKQSSLQFRSFLHRLVCSSSRKRPWLSCRLR